MSAMANTTPIVTTVTKPVTNPRDTDATPRVNIQDLCEEYYEDILPIIMDKVRRDKRKEVHARLDFKEGFRERRTREGSHYSSARTISARPERLKVRDRLRYNDGHVFGRLGHRRQSAFDRLSETYLPSTTESRPSRTSSRDHSHELTKRLNEHVPKTMKEMMITTTAFIRGEAAAASKKKGHTSWRTQDQSKRQNSEKRSDFRGQPREGRGSSRFTPLQGHQ
nr:reverse transcriptase domain-containing protein [Tanacetum cinerariifolium]